MTGVILSSDFHFNAIFSCTLLVLHNVHTHTVRVTLGISFVIVTLLNNFQLDIFDKSTTRLHCLLIPFMLVKYQYDHKSVNVIYKMFIFELLYTLKLYTKH